MAKGKSQLNRVSHALVPTSYPWRTNNSVQILINAEAFYPAMLAAINTAKYYVLLEMYLFESGQVAGEFIDAFLDAAQRGVKIYLLLDDFGCHGLNQKDRNKLSHQNIYIHYYNPLHYGGLRRNLFRDHRKILIIDRQLAFVGGAGITDAFKSYSNREPGWRETMLEICGECVADWTDAFNNIWQVYGNQQITLNADAINNVEERLLCRVNCTMSGNIQGIKKSLLKRIRRSEQSCWISTAYFVPSFKIRRALARVARRGVDVRILLPGPKSDHPAIRHVGRRFYHRLLKAGVKIYEYQPRFIHQKVLLCDNWVSIGSSNIDRWNFRWNLEANQEIEDQAVAEQVRQMFEQDFKQCIQCELSHWLGRSFYTRCLEWFWGKVDRLVDRYIR